ncbi:MAG: alpha/beta hydrolase [Pseudomonadota bacterium]|nr:alpha/beta hydrolase [Pseudomonadota bacterium]
MALFPEGFKQVSAQTGLATIFARTGGSGPALLLLHGFPQTHAMWHKVVPRLMRQFTCVIPDLRGYGFSSCPPNDHANFAYSKRAMAQDMVALMSSLGHERFAVVGHDRGGRVAYRMALDEPSRVRAVALLDIISTYHMWRGLDAPFAMKVYHWLFLAQPHPLPEMLIEQAPVGFLDYTLASWTKAGNLSAFDADALAEYRLHFATPEHIHAACNDYRAGWTYDLEADNASRAAGQRIACPLFVVWGEAGIPAETSAMLDSWKEWASRADGKAIDSGHFLAEENPDATLDALLPFLTATAGP